MSLFFDYAYTKDYINKFGTNNMIISRWPSQDPIYCITMHTRINSGTVDLNANLVKLMLEYDCRYNSHYTNDILTNDINILNTKN